MKLTHSGRGYGCGCAFVVALGVLAAEAASSPATPDQTNAPAALAATNAVPNKSDFSPYRIIAERNIFNAGRSGRASRPSREATRQVRIDAFTLVGTLGNATEILAFFDGTSGDYRKVLRQGGEIGGYQVAAVTPKGVTLAREQQTVDLQVGMQMRREDGGSWNPPQPAQPVANSRGTASAQSGSSTTASTSSGGGDASTGGEADDVLRRLMQQREKEMK